MTGEERQRTMDFILEQQARFTVNMESMRESQARTDANIEALTEAQARTDAAIGALTTQVQNLARQQENIARQQEHLNEVVAVIADARPHNDELLKAMIDVVQQGRNGKG